jgi:hypothetical protein
MADQAISSQRCAGENLQSCAILSFSGDTNIYSEIAQTPRVVAFSASRQKVFSLCFSFEENSAIEQAPFLPASA